MAKKKKLSKTGKVILDLILAASLCTALFSGWQLYKGLREYSESRSAYEQIRKETAAVRTDVSETEETVIDFEVLKKINPDFGGWIRLADSNIDYPFVYAPDYSYYLTHLFTGEYNRSGTVFTDARCSRDLADRVTVMYAHHMRNGTMFADVENYRDPAYYGTHKEFDIYTENGTYKMYPLAGYVTDGSQDYVRLSFDGDSDFSAYIQGFIEKSGFESDVSFSADDKILMLSTCSYDVDNGRYVLIGKLDKIKE